MSPVSSDLENPGDTTARNEEDNKGSRGSSYPSPPSNGQTPPFVHLTTLFERLSKERKADQRRKILDKWFNGWRRDVGLDLYPVLRLLLPQKDTERALYGLKETNLAKAYIKVIPLGPKDPDAIRLLKWKKPVTRDVTAGDFPTVLFEVINKRSSVAEGTLTVEDVNNVLDELSKNSGRQEIQTKILQRVYNSTTSEEQRWIARIILKDMQISVREGVILSVYHPDGSDLYNACSDLKKVAYQLWDKERRLSPEDKQIMILQRFSPMLCFKPGSRLENAIKGMSGKPFIIEEKLDGERMQLHIRGKEYYYCSRNGKNYTYLYGIDAGNGSLTPHIQNAFDERIKEIILDGEMLVWDPITERSLPFGSLKTAAIARSNGRLSPRPCFKVFDLLYLNGMCLMHRSLKFRKRNLRAYVKEIKGRLEFVTEFEGTTIADVRKHLEDIVESRGEGLVLKHPNSQYVLGGRERDWVKVKPEYMDNMGESVELVVIGANYGTGWRSGGVSALICAVRDDRRTNGGEEDGLKLSSFARVGTGLSYADFIWIRQKNWKALDKNNIPSWYQVSKKGTDDKGDVYLEPEDFFVLEIKAAEITPSDQYHIGFTMRFPRARKIRDDKDVSEILTVTEVLENLKTKKKRKIEDSEEKPEQTKKSKSSKKPITVMPEFRGESMKGVSVNTNIFDELKFMVSSDPRNRNGEKEKRQLLKLIHENGGSYVQVVKGDTPILVVYGGLSTPYDLKLIIDKNIHDVIRPSWIYDCIEQGKVLPLQKKYFFFATDKRKASEEFSMGDKREGEGEASASESKSGEDQDESSAQPGVKEEPEVLEGPYSDWLKVDKAPEGQAKGQDDEEDDPDSDTEPDSEFDALRFDEELKEWVIADDLSSLNIQEDEIPPSVEEETLNDTENEEASNDAEAEEGVPVRMGETESAMEYDLEKIFRHLCFYLDTPSNAERHGMDIKPKFRNQITTSFAEVENLITSNGGRVADLDDPKLTHVVLDKRDTSRCKELIKRTSQPKRRYLVLTDFVHGCLEESSLLDESGFEP